jgi:hypothetical protein
MLCYYNNGSLVICNGHDSYISGSFNLYTHCIQNQISLLILPPHTSHVLQPLNVAIFGPLKQHLITTLSQLNEAQLLCIHKSEWMEAYIKAREAAFLNVESAWRGLGLQPFQPQRVICMATLPLMTYVEQRMISLIKCFKIAVLTFLQCGRQIQ